MSGTPFCNLKNHFLIAMPSMVDHSFVDTLTLICEHSSKGAIGIIVNRPSGLQIREIFRQVGVKEYNTNKHSQHAVYSGGPVAQERGFVLNTGEFKWNSRLDICHGLQLVTSTDIIVAMAEDKEPNGYLVALGYVGWGAGQLEKELLKNVWLTCEADPTIIFETPYHLRLNAAASSLGINFQLISSQVGHA